MTLLTILGGFLSHHWLDLLLVLIFIAILAILWKLGHKTTVKRIIRGLVAKAEQQYGSKTGPIKWTEVWTGIYEKLPWVIRVVFTQAELEGYIEDGLKWLDKLLADNPDANLLTYAEERQLPSGSESADP